MPEIAHLTLEWVPGASHLSEVKVDGKVLPVSRFEILARVDGHGELVLHIPMYQDTVEVKTLPVPSAVRA